MQIDQLNKLVTRAVFVSVISPIISIPIVGFLAWSLYQSHQTLQNVVKQAQIYVVPGALAGRYKAGLNDETLINNARYWTGLLTNVTRKSAGGRLAELESFADNSFLVGFQKLRDQMLAEIDQQSQGRNFVERSNSAKLQRNPDGSYTFTVAGDRTFFSAGIILFEDQAVVEWHFRIGSPSATNQYGLAFLGVDVRVVPGSRKTS